MNLFRPLSHGLYRDGGSGSPPVLAYTAAISPTSITDTGSPQEVDVILTNLSGVSATVTILENSGYSQTAFLPANGSVTSSFSPNPGPDATVSYSFTNDAGLSDPSDVSLYFAPGGVNYPTSVSLNGDGDTFSAPADYSPTWSVDGGDDTADVYLDSSYVGTGTSGSVSIHFDNPDESHTIFVVCTSGSNPASNTITVNTSP